MKIWTYGYTDIGGRTENEDSYSFSKSSNSLFASLADGLGGHGGGKDASQTAVSCFEEYKKEDILRPDAIKTAFERANKLINDKKSNAYNMKTTAVLLSVCNNKAIWAHIGDSRLYHFYNYKIADYTIDQSVSQLAVELGEITRDEIPFHPERSRLVQALGSEDIMPVIHEEITLDKGFHCFLLCSDGFWEYIYDNEMLMDLHKAKNPEKWIKFMRIRLQKKVMKNNDNNDNNTAIAVFLEV